MIYSISFLTSDSNVVSALIPGYLAKIALTASSKSFATLSSSVDR